MRVKPAVLALALLAGFAAPARAQYITPFSGSWILSDPVPYKDQHTPDAATPTDAPQNCALASGGRQGPRYDCKPAAATKDNGRH